MATLRWLNGNLGHSHVRARARVCARVRGIPLSPLLTVFCGGQTARRSKGNTFLANPIAMQASQAVGELDGVGVVTGRVGPGERVGWGWGLMFSPLGARAGPHR